MWINNARNERESSTIFMVMRLSAVVYYVGRKKGGLAGKKLQCCALCLVPCTFEPCVLDLVSCTLYLEPCVFMSYFNANRMVRAKASGTKLMSGRMSNSGFQSSERLTGALVNL